VPVNPSHSKPHLHLETPSLVKLAQDDDWGFLELVLERMNKNETIDAARLSEKEGGDTVLTLLAKANLDPTRKLKCAESIIMRIPPEQVQKFVNQPNGDGETPGGILFKSKQLMVASLLSDFCKHRSITFILVASQSQASTPPADDRKLVWDAGAFDADG